MITNASRLTAILSFKFSSASNTVVSSYEFTSASPLTVVLSYDFTCLTTYPFTML